VSSWSGISKALSGLALTGAACCSSQWPAKSIYFSHASETNTLTLLDQGNGNGHNFIEDTIEPTLLFNAYCTPMIVPYGVLCLNTHITNYVLHIMMHSDFCLRSQDGAVHQNVLYCTILCPLMQ